MTVLRSQPPSPAAPRAADAGLLSLTDEQRIAVEWGEGPLMVLAGAGTGKTTVIVERVAWLLGRGSHPSTLEPVEPENVLVLTYNVRAAAELVERFERRLGPDVASRVWIQNFHSLGHRLLRENAAEAYLPERAEVLDGIGQRLLLNELRADLPLLYHQFHDLRGQLGHLADVVNRARDELATPGEYRAHVDGMRDAFEARYGAGAYAATVAELHERGDLRQVRDVRRALARSEPEGEKAADREARRAVGGTGRALTPRQLTDEQRAIADGLRPTFLRDAAALEVLRLEEEAAVYAAYVDALRDRGAVDFGEQILRVIALLEERPNVLRRYQRQFRHVLVDEFQDANVAQIMLLELVGRSPDRADNVVVVGDDDQSIYRFRGASYAAFEQFEQRFSVAPPWDPERAAGPVARSTLLLNRRSSANVVAAASRLVERNERRLKTEPLQPARPAGDPVELIVATDEADEAEAVVDAIRRAFASLPERIATGPGTRPRRWSDVAVLYRKHRHREAIAKRLRDADIPFVVVGGAGLFEHPDVRDVECALRSIANPADSVSVTRLLAAPPWRLDATEILRLTRAAQFGRLGAPEPITVFQAVADALRERQLLLEAVPAAEGASNGDGANGHRAAPDPSAVLQLSLLPLEEETPAPAPSRPAPRRPRFQPGPLPDATRAKLERLMDCTAELATRARRDGPFTILDEYLVRTALLHDLVATGTPEAQRAVLALARLMRFVSDWQREHPRGSLADFIAYLDLYQDAGGDLDAETGSTDVDGVQLMTVHQAKGLEWEVVVVPRLVEGQFPDARADELVIPVELLRQEPPGDFQEAEERRLCYVAMTRGRSRLVLTAIESADGRQRASRFVGEVAPWAVDESSPAMPDVSVTWRQRVEAELAAQLPEDERPAEGSANGNGVQAAEAARTARITDELARRLPVPTAFERRFALRRRAVEIIGLLEHVAPDDHAARERLLTELVTVAKDAAHAAGEQRERGLDPLTLRVVADDAPSGAQLLRLVPPPDRFSHTAFSTYLECPLQYAFQRVYHIPVPDEDRKGYFTFGSIVHEAFEAFGRAQHEARAAGLPRPDESDLQRFFERAWQPIAFADQVTAESYRGRGPAILRNFYARQLSRLAESVCFEQPFRLSLSPPGGGTPVLVSGAIDRIDRLPDGSLELVDYKTGRPRTQEQVDADPQLSTYALAMREGAVLDPATGRPLPGPSRLTLYFTESDEWLSTTRTDPQLDAHRDGLLDLAARIRSGDFAANPEMRRCDRCDYRRLCPSRWGAR